MPANFGQLRVEGLTALQLAELQAAIRSAGEEAVTVLENPDLGGGRVGEPALLTVVITIGPSVISAVALWMAKNRKRRTRSVKYTKVSADGAMESFELDESSYAEGASAPSAIQAFLEKKLRNDVAAAG